MSLADIDKEFRRIRDLVTQGSTLIDDRKFEEAQTVLFDALKQIDALKMPASREKLDCLEKLGDAYYAQKRFIEARAVYQQLDATMQEYEMEPQEKSLALFKLAMATDKVQDFEMASDLFSRSLETAEACMNTGDPLLTELYEAYASLLRRARLDPVKLKQLESKARLSRQKQAGITESLFDPRDEEKKKKKLEEEAAYYETLSSAQRIIYLSRLHPLAALGVLFSPVFAAVLFLITVATMALVGVDIGFIPALNVGDVYSTADGSVKIKITSAHGADVISGKPVHVNVRNLNRWSELITTVHQGRSQYWLKRGADKFTGDDGLVLYREGSSESKIEPLMIEFGKAIYKCAEDEGDTSSVVGLRKYGFDAAKYKPDFSISTIDFAHQISDERQSEAKVHAIDTPPREVLEGLEKGVSGDIESIFPPFGDQFTATLPVSIVCFTHKDAIAIVAFDATRNRMRTTDDSRYLTCSSLNIKSIAPQINEPLRYVPRIIGKTDLLFADRSKDDVGKKYFHLFLSLLLLLLLLPGGVILARMWNREEPQFDYYANPNYKQGIAIWWAVYMGCCLFYLAYLGWILFG